MNIVNFTQMSEEFKGEYKNQFVNSCYYEYNILFYWNIKLIIL